LLLQIFSHLKEFHWTCIYSGTKWGWSRCCRKRVFNSAT